MTTTTTTSTYREFYNAAAELDHALAAAEKAAERLAASVPDLRGREVSARHLPDHPDFLDLDAARMAPFCIPGARLAQARTEADTLLAVVANSRPYSPLADYGGDPVDVAESELSPAQVVADNPPTRGATLLGARRIPHDHPDRFLGDTEFDRVALYAVPSGEYPQARALYFRQRATRAWSLGAN